MAPCFWHCLVSDIHGTTTLGEQPSVDMSSTRDAHSYACDECRLRKTRCSKDRPTCLQCRQLGKLCNYSTKIARSPLTRQYLTYVEERLFAFETALGRLFPGADLDAVLNSLLHDHNQQTEAQMPLKTPGKSEVANTAEAAEATPEEVPQRADGFDWAEKEISLGDLTDGMAALSVKPEGTGYFGSSSSVVPLRALLSHGFDLDLSPSTKPNNIAMNRIPLKSQILNSAPSGLIEQAFVDAYFRNYHTSYPFVHEASFRSQFQGQSPRPHEQAWQILFYAILALGAWSVGDDNSDLDVIFYQEARGFLQQASVFETGNLTLVQALLLLSNYAQKRNKPNTGWNYLGLAVRMAMSLGLHKEFPDWKISCLQREIRRRVWWGVYIFDSGAAKTFGRPILLPENKAMDAKHVLNIHDEALTESTTSLPAEANGPTLYTGLISQAKLHLLTNKVYQRLISAPSLTPEETLALQKPMDEWYNSLPMYIRQPPQRPPLEPESLALVRRRLMWRDWNLRILLYRPVLLRWASRRWVPNSQSNVEEDLHELDCRMRCLQNARLTISSISEYMAHYVCTRLGAWYMLYFLFQASLIPIIHLMTDSTNPDSASWLQDIDTTKSLFSHPSLSNNHLATRCFQVISRLSSPGRADMTNPQFSGQLFADASAGLDGLVFIPDVVGETAQVDQIQGMDFSEWVNFTPQVELDDLAYC